MPKNLKDKVGWSKVTTFIFRVAIVVAGTKPFTLTWEVIIKKDKIKT